MLQFIAHLSFFLGKKGKELFIKKYSVNRWSLTRSSFSIWIKNQSEESIFVQFLLIHSLTFLSLRCKLKVMVIKIYSLHIAYIVPTVILTKSWPEFSLLTLRLTPPSHYRTDTETFSLFPHYSSHTHLVSVFPSKIYISMRFLQIFLPNK